MTAFPPGRSQLEEVAAVISRLAERDEREAILAKAVSAAAEDDVERVEAALTLALGLDD